MKPHYSPPYRAKPEVISSRNAVCQFLIAAAILSACLLESTAAQVDQENWDPQSTGGAVRTIQQEFTPTLDKVDSVQLLMSVEAGVIWFGGPSWVNIRQGGVDGPILAASKPTYAPYSYQGTIGYGFAEPVPLVPGQVYAIEPVSNPSGSIFPLRMTPDQYPGRLLLSGQFANKDLVFREGLGLDLIPEPAPIVLVAAALGLTAAVRAGWVGKGRRSRLNRSSDGRTHGCTEPGDSASIPGRTSVAPGRRSGSLSLSTPW